MSDYTPTLDETDEAMRFLTERSIVREGLANRATARKMVNRWLEQVKAEAWDEGHRTPQIREPHDCRCGAWYEGECACGLFGTGEIITPNPYREKEQDA